MPRLSKTEIYAIRWLNSQGKTIEQISNELKISDTQVKKTLEKNHVSSDTKNSIKTATEKTTSKMKDLMITKTSSKNINSVAIMTKEASEISDANKKTNTTSISKAFKNSIYRPHSSK